MTQRKTLYESDMTLEGLRRRLDLYVESAQQDSRDFAETDRTASADEVEETLDAISESFAENAQAAGGVAVKARQRADEHRAQAEAFDALAGDAESQAETILLLGKQTAERIRQNTQSMFDRIGRPDGDGKSLADVVAELEHA